MADNRTSMLGIRVTPKELDALGDLAKQRGFKNLSKWGREILLAELTREQGGEPQKLPEAAYQAIDRLTRPVDARQAIAPLARILWPVQDMPPEEFARRYPEEAAAVEAERRGLTEQERIDTCLTVGTGYGRVVMGAGKPDKIPSEASGADGGAEAGSGGTANPGVALGKGEPPQSGEILRDPVTGIGLNHIREFTPPSRSWSSEWDAIDQMEPAEALARFNELRAGRPLPTGFRGMSRTQRIAWLSANWKL